MTDKMFIIVNFSIAFVYSVICFLFWKELLKHDNWRNPILFGIAIHTLFGIVRLYYSLKDRYRWWKSIKEEIEKITE